MPESYIIPQALVYSFFLYLSTAIGWYSAKLLRLVYSVKYRNIILILLIRQSISLLKVF